MSPSFQKCELPAQCGVIQAGLEELLLLVFPMSHSMSDIEEKYAPGPQHTDSARLLEECLLSGSDILDSGFGDHTESYTQTPWALLS